MKNKFPKIIYLLVCFLLIFEQSGFTQVAGQLDISGYFTGLRNVLIQDRFRPLHLRYLSYDNLSNNFNILLDQGDFKPPQTQELKNLTKELLNYFFIGISLPNDSFWVNLRPDSPDNIIDSYLAQTDLGKVLLEADLQLKKDTANFTSPQTPEGKDYWKKLYQKANELFGGENITIPTLTRPWIVPGEIIIRQTQENAYVYKATLKVMLEQDYLKDSTTYNFTDERLKQLNEYASELIRKTIIPKLTKDVNTAKRYASLRQVYYSLILAQWFKQKFYGKSGLYSQLINKKNLNGLTSKESWSKETYFQAYQKSFREGEYNIKEQVYALQGQTIRNYMSGGITIGGEVIDQAIKSGIEIRGNTLRPIVKLDREITVEFNPGTIQDPYSGEINIQPQKSVSSSVEENRGASSSPAASEDQRGDSERRYTISRIAAQIDDYAEFETRIGRIQQKIEQNTPLEWDEVLTIIELRKRVLMKNPLVALSLYAKPGRLVTVLSLPGIKALNTALGMPGADRVLGEFHKAANLWLARRGLIPLDRAGELAHSYKQHRVVLREGVNQEEASRELDKVTSDIEKAVAAYLAKAYPGRQELQGFNILSHYGTSQIGDSNDIFFKILADFEALVAAKIARRDNRFGETFNHKEFDVLMLEAENIRKELGLVPGELPPVEKMMQVRGKTEKELEGPGNKELLLIKKYLDIIDLMDYPKVWRAQAERRREELERMLVIMEMLEHIIAGRAPPGLQGLSVEPGIDKQQEFSAIQSAMNLIKTSSKNHRITSGEAFFSEIHRLIEQNHDGVIVAMDKIGFWLEIQQYLAEAHQEYLKVIDSDAETKRRVMLEQAMAADDKVKRLMAQTVDILAQKLGTAIPSVKIDGESRLLVNQDGGDEIIFFIPRRQDWERVVPLLSDSGLGVRIVAAQIDPRDLERGPEIALGLAVTKVTHTLDQAYVSAQTGDKKAKALEGKGIWGAVLSEELNSDGVMELVVYYDGRRVQYDDFTKDRGASSPVASDDGFDAEVNLDYLAPAFTPPTLQETQAAAGSSAVDTQMVKALNGMKGLEIKKEGETYKFEVQNRNNENWDRIVVLKDRRGEEVGFFELSTKSTGYFNARYIKITNKSYLNRGFARLILAEVRKVFPDGKTITTEIASEESLKDLEEGKLLNSTGIVRLFESAGWEFTEGGYYDGNGEYHKEPFDEIMADDIRKGEAGFVAVKFKAKGVQPYLPGFLPEATDDQSSSSITDTKGGIDFRALPTTTQSGFSVASGNIPTLRPLANINLDEAWVQIQNMLHAGIIPSSERIKEYLQACCEKKDIHQEIDKILACIADILRLQEERAISTDLSLKKMLALLESDKPANEMQFVLTKIIVQEKEPLAIMQ
jgi:hypothetical protein